MVQLSVKESTVFQTALQQYEKKEYKESLENVNKLQKLIPGHGESLCLRGLLLHHLGQKGALESIQQGVKADPNSSVGWHMAGIYYRLSKMYPEAIKAYNKSFRLNKDNASVQHDLSMLAMQERDIPLLVQARSQMLAAKPNVKMVWVGLAIAHYLNKDYSSALKTLSLQEEFTASDPASKATKTADEKHQANIEASELAYFRNLIVWKGQGAKAALADLRENEKKIWDKLAVAERRAELLVADGQVNAAKAAFTGLVHRNPDNGRYYEALRKLTPNEDETQFFKRCVKELPTANWPRGEYLAKLAADDNKKDEFYSELKSYLEKWLVKKGTPATFEFVKQFYGSESSKDVLDSVVSSLNLDDDDVVHQVFLARHLAYSGKVKEGLSKIGKLPKEHADVALAHAKILQIAGDYKGAAAVLAAASESDPGDRFLNTKAAKYALRAGQIQRGLELATVFPLSSDKSRNIDTALKHMIELESVDFFSHLAQNLQRVGDHALAFKYANVVLDIFSNYHKEQFDFHYYGPRRGTIIAYLGLIEWEDNLWLHPRLRQALKIAVEEAFFASSFTPTAGNTAAVSTQPTSASSADSSTATPTSEGDKAGTSDESTSATPDDTDPSGEILFTSATALDNAFNVWKHVEKSLPTDPTTWQTAFNIYLVQKKYILATQALKKAREFGASSQWIAAAAVRARYTLEADSDAPEVLRKLQLKMLPTIATEGDITNDNLAAYADKFVRSENSLLLWVQTRAFLPDGVEDVDSYLSGLVRSLSAADSESLVSTLRRSTGNKDNCTKLASAVKAAYPLETFTN